MALLEQEQEVDDRGVEEVYASRVRAVIDTVSEVETSNTTCDAELSGRKSLIKLLVRAAVKRSCYHIRLDQRLM
jgi:hypothetical protein